MDVVHQKFGKGTVMRASLRSTMTWASARKTWSADWGALRAGKWDPPEAHSVMGLATDTA